MSRHTNRLVMLIALLVLSRTALANGGTWLLPVQTFLSVHVAYQLSVVLIEAFLIMRVFDRSWRNAFGISIAANIVSYVPAFFIGVFYQGFLRGFGFELTPFVIAQVFILVLNIVTESVVLEQAIPPSSRRAPYLRREPFLLRVAAINAGTWLLGVVVVGSVLMQAKHVPSFSRIRADQRSMATGLESYFVDNNAYPPGVPLRLFASRPGELERAGGARLQSVSPLLTTPVGYLTALFPDPMAPAKCSFAYHTDGPGWILISPGPDGYYDINPVTDYNSSDTQPSARLTAKSYDPTNGFISSGDLFRVSQ